jgi:predicted acyl esterase
MGGNTMRDIVTKIYTVGELRTKNIHGHAYEAKIIFDQDVPATMRDGVTLMTNVFRPHDDDHEGDGKYPAIICMAPYGKDSMPPDSQFERIRNVGVLPFSELAGWETPDPAFWVPSGYVLVNVDCRGTNNSGGASFEHMSPEMARDFHDVVEWVAAQEWCDGNVGSNGVSYLAASQWLGAAENPPHLKAIMPWEGFNDFYRDHVCHGGMPDTGFFHEIWGRRMNPQTGFIARDAVPEKIIEAQTEHPLYDEFWEAKRVKLENITVPAYIVAGWATQGLHTRGSIEGYKRISSKEKWLEGHGRKEWESYYNREALERQRRFFDCFLKGLDSGIRDLPRVRLEIRDRFYEGRTRFFDDFPVPGTDYRPLYLNAADSSVDASMTDAKPDNEASVRYAANQSEGEADTTSWSYTFAEDADLAGNMKLRLWVAAEGADDLDLHVGLKKFDRHGNEVPFLDFQHVENGMVASGWLRVSHREQDEALSMPGRPWLKHERRLKLSEGEIVPAEVEILPSATGFRAGDRLELIVKGHDIPEPFARFKHRNTVNAGRHVIHAGGQYDSYLLIPVLPKG